MSYISLPVSKTITRLIEPMSRKDSVNGHWLLNVTCEISTPNFYSYLYQNIFKETFLWKLVNRRKKRWEDWMVKNYVWTKRVFYTNALSLEKFIPNRRSVFLTLSQSQHVSARQCGTLPAHIWDVLTKAPISWLAPAVEWIAIPVVLSSFLECGHTSTNTFFMCFHQL